MKFGENEESPTVKNCLSWKFLKDHIDDGVKKAFTLPKVGTKLTVIPRGLKILQPLGISVNQSFKCKIWAQGEDWMSNELKEYTKSKSVKKHL